MARISSAALAALTVLAFGIGCGGSTSTTQTNTSPYRIGVSVPLTGAFTDLSRPAKNGFEMWAAEVNARGGLMGRKIELTEVDNKSDADTGVTVYQNFLSQNMDLAIELGTATLADRESTLAEQRKKLFLCPICFTRSQFERGYQYMFSTAVGIIPDISNGLASLVNSMPAGNRPQTIAYAYADAPGSISGIVGFKATLDKVGMKTVMDTSYPQNISDPTGVVLQMKRANADMILVNGYVNDEVLLAKGIFQQGLHPKLLSISSTATGLPNWIDLVGLGAGDGVVFNIPWLPIVKQVGSPEFAAAYQKKYGLPASYTAAQTYAAGQVLEAGINGTKSFDQTKIKDYLKSHTIRAVDGDLKFNQQGFNVPTDGSPTVQYQNGVMQVIFPANQKTASLIYPRP